ncbi:MAG: hypothetical protein MUE37_07335 [Bacteroidales bacterium]|jgi:hypothetical protein|nr:hypothetical protein [Bacteroidales bacterium]
MIYNRFGFRGAGLRRQAGGSQSDVEPGELNPAGRQAVGSQSDVEPGGWSEAAGRRKPV